MNPEILKEAPEFVTADKPKTLPKTRKNTMRPVGDNIIIQLEQVETVTSSGFVIPESAVNPPQNALVIAIADDQEKVKAGDKLIVRPHSGQPFEHDGNEYRLIHINEIMAIL